MKRFNRALLSFVLVSSALIAEGEQLAQIEGLKTQETVLAQPADAVSAVAKPLFSVARPSESEIATHKQKATQEMRWNKIARLGVEGAKWTIGIFTAYKILQSFGVTGGVPGTVPQVPKTEMVAGTAMTLEGMQQKMEAMQYNLTDLNEKFKKQAAILSPSFFSLQWFKNAGYVLSEHLIAAIAAGTIYRTAEQYLYEGILHKGDISWFVGTKTNLLSSAELVPIVMPMELIMGSAIPLGQLGGVFQKDMSAEQNAMLGKYAAMMLPQNNLRKTIFEELKGYAAALGDATTTDLDKQPVILIASACNSLVHQVESILGFMEFKQQGFVSDKARAEAAASTRFIFNATHEFCKKMEDVFNNTTIDAKTRKNQTESVINSYKNDIARMLISFSRIEKDQKDK